MKKEIISNKGYCKECETEIESESRHDFTSCECEDKGVAVDGGKKYLRRVGPSEKFEERSETELVFDGLQDKIQHGRNIVRDALESYDNPVIGFTGGKDSTLVLWLVKEVCDEHGYDKPTMMFIDHGQHFEEMVEYAHSIADEWGFELDIARNGFLTDFKAGEEVNVQELPEDQKKELEDKFGYDVEKIVETNEEYDAELPESIKNSLNTVEGNHLLKTFPMNQYIEENEVDAVINGIRWDEHESRSDESFFSEREDHTRIHPILHVTERDVWDITWFRIVPQETEGGWVYGYPRENQEKEFLKKEFPYTTFPVAPKYWQGFRSLGSETQTQKTSEKAAWHQDLTEGTEREGRAQDKDSENAMAELRDKGYM